MQIILHAIGRMKSGPEKDLCARYLDRLAKVGPPLGLTGVQLIEKPESRADTADRRSDEEGTWLLAARDAAAGPAKLIVLDERGKTFSSPAFAERIARERDEGCRSLVFALGGPDGHGESVRSEADAILSFGSATWPHQLARIMLAEQLYRAATLMAGHPYHRV